MAVRTSPPQIYVHAVFVSELRSTLFAYRSHLFARIFHRPFFLRAPAISFCFRLLSSLGVFLLQFLLLIRSSCFYILVHSMFSMLRTILCAMLTTMICAMLDTMICAILCRCAILSRGGPRIQEGARVLKRGPESLGGGSSAQEGARVLKRGLSVRGGHGVESVRVHDGPCVQGGLMLQGFRCSSQTGGTRSQVLNMRP